MTTDGSGPGGFSAEALDLPPTGTCELTTVGRRSGQSRRVEIWYVVVDGHLVLTGTPGNRDWFANVRVTREAVLHLRHPARDVAVTAQEVTAAGTRRRVVQEAWRLQPWYAEQPFSVEDWVAGSPMVILTPTAGGAGAAARRAFGTPD